MRSKAASFVGDASTGQAATPLAQNGRPGPAISVEITTPERFATLGRAWEDLVPRALAANVFLEPGLVAAAALADEAAFHVLLAWATKPSGGPIRLVGAWAFACRRPSSGLPLLVLKTPVHDHAFLGTPVLDADLAGEVLLRMLEAIAEAPGLPNLIEITSLDAAGPVAAVFADVLRRRGTPHARLEARLRPQLKLGQGETGAGAAILSAGRDKSIRRRRKRLGTLGEITWSIHKAPSEIGPAIAEFTALEAAGWKGRPAQRGRAILLAPETELFFRTALENLAQRGQVAFTALRCDGKPVAMQVTIRSGSTAFTWKTAYDETLRACAPGIILLQEVTTRLLEDPDVTGVDSCNHRDDGNMAEFWCGRRPVLDIVLDAGEGRSASFLLLSHAEMAKRRLKIVARGLRSRLVSFRQGAERLRQSWQTRFRTTAERPAGDIRQAQGAGTSAPEFVQDALRATATGGLHPAEGAR